MLVQYDIMQRADIMFKDSVGRFYGGTLTEDQIETLTARPEAKHQRNS